MVAKSKNKYETATIFPGGKWLVIIPKRDTAGICLLKCQQASGLIFWFEMRVTHRGSLRQLPASPWPPWSPGSQELPEQCVVWSILDLPGARLKLFLGARLPM